MLKEQQEARKEREALRIRMMNADPFDLEAQTLIAKEIEQKNIDHNMELAMEARWTLGTQNTIAVTNQLLFSAPRALVPSSCSTSTALSTDIKSKHLLTLGPKPQSCHR